MREAKKNDTDRSDGEEEEKMWIIIWRLCERGREASEQEKAETIYLFLTLEVGWVQWTHFQIEYLHKFMIIIIHICLSGNVV